MKMASMQAAVQALRPLLGGFFWFMILEPEAEGFRGFRLFSLGFRASEILT